MTGVLTTNRSGVDCTQCADVVFAPPPKRVSHVARQTAASVADSDAPVAETQSRAGDELVRDALRVGMLHDPANRSLVFLA